MTISNELFQLQIEQKKHDDLCHKDILCLPVQRRITHMSLHFAKYTGHIAQLNNEDNKKLINTLVDSIIICLASANCLNINLSERISLGDVLGRRNINALDKAFYAKYNEYIDNDLIGFLLKKYALHSGVIAKACESLDHLEPYDFRVNIEKEVIELTELSLLYLAKLDIDTMSLVRQRWKFVENKSIFSKDKQSHIDPSYKKSQ